ncbi:hypothetical protein [Amycolatopsis sp. TNS106]|uniref:hypothetical protein n=1 Tax=Amycolatopsis sp. TNS106 TaxID=2861750 RepID=UPI001C58184A|nr:hypothetical protein [Amycolatopsis sp. TNS106]QXV62050.1 hypothetical protein CVV72_37040 [Amycolatopsis sp. TNS106]
MAEPEQLRPSRGMHADCQDHPGVSTGKSSTEIYEHSLDADTGVPAAIVELSGWDNHHRLGRSATHA